MCYGCVWDGSSGGCGDGTPGQETRALSETPARKRARATRTTMTRPRGRRRGTASSWWWWVSLVIEDAYLTAVWTIINDKDKSSNITSRLKTSDKTHMSVYGLKLGVGCKDACLSHDKLPERFILARRVGKRHKDGKKKKGLRRSERDERICMEWPHCCWRVAQVRNGG